MKNTEKSLLLIIVAMIWGTAFVAQSKGMDYVEPFTYCAMRMLLGGAMLIPVIMVLDAKRSKEERQRIRENRKTQVLGGLCCGVAICVSSMFQQFGVKDTTVGKASFITALYIVIVPVISIFLKKHVSNLAAVSVVLAVAGFYLLCINKASGIGIGDLLVLVCAFGFSTHIIIIDYFSPRVDGVRMACMQFLVCGIISLVGMFLFENPSLEAIWNCRLEIGYSGVMSCGVAYTLQIIAQKDVNPTVASLLMSLESVFGAIAGYFILGETFSKRQFAGCVIIFAAVILAQIPEKKKADKI